jgi:hypothetical protein
MICRRRKILFIHVPKTAGTSLEAAIWGDARARENLYGPSAVGFLQHLTIDELLGHGLVTPEELNAHLKFCFVRNPWDRAVSEYHWVKSGKGTAVALTRGDTFDDFCHALETKQIVPPCNPHLRRQIDFVQGVDFVGRYENLEDDFARICAMAGLGDLVLPRLNASEFRSATYHEYYSDETRALVGKLYQSDAEAFGYEF